MPTLVEKFAQVPKARGKLATDQFGQRVSTLDPTACSWCAVGFLARTLGINTTDTGVAIELLPFPTERLETLWYAHDMGETETVTKILEEFDARVPDKLAG